MVWREGASGVACLRRHARLSSRGDERERRRVALTGERGVASPRCVTALAPPPPPAGAGHDDRAQVSPHRHRAQERDRRRARVARRAHEVRIRRRSGEAGGRRRGTASDKRARARGGEGGRCAPRPSDAHAPRVARAAAATCGPPQSKQRDGATTQRQRDREPATATETEPTHISVRFAGRDAEAPAAELGRRDGTRLASPRFVVCCAPVAAFRRRSDLPASLCAAPPSRRVAAAVISPCVSRAARLPASLCCPRPSRRAAARAPFQRRRRGRAARRRVPLRRRDGRLARRDRGAAPLGQ